MFPCRKSERCQQLDPECSELVHPSDYCSSTSCEGLILRLADHEKFCKYHEHGAQDSTNQESWEHDCNAAEIESPFAPSSCIIASPVWHYIFKFFNGVAEFVHLGPGPFHYHESNYSVKHEQNYLPAVPMPIGLILFYR